MKLLSVFDANCCFTLIDAGARGREDDKSVFSNSSFGKAFSSGDFNPLNPELNSICYLLALLAHHFLHVSRIKVKLLTSRLLMSYIYIYMTLVT